MTSFKHLIFAAALALMTLLTACSLSNEDLAKEVRAGIQEKFKGTGMEIKSFALTHKGGNEYKGILETKEPNGEFTYSVEVISDGKTFTWEIVN